MKRLHSRAEVVEGDERFVSHEDGLKFRHVESQLHVEGILKEIIGIEERRGMSGSDNLRLGVAGKILDADL
jgi:hypothetical protein